MTPRCSDCAHWQRTGDVTPDRPRGWKSVATGTCGVVGVSVRIGFWPGANRTFTTPADFGCSHHSEGWAAPAAAARAGDPDTSHEAARSIDRINARRLAVLRALDAPLTDAALVDKHQSWLVGNPKLPQAPSGIRSRRAELVQLGLVAHVDTVRIASRRHRVWARTPAGDRVARTGSLT